MNEVAFKSEFYDRRKLSPSRKNYYYIIGAIEIIIGLFGIIKLGTLLNPLYLVLTIGGILSIAYGLNGRELIKERNFISINSHEIKFKNSFRKLQSILINELLDMRIETNKVEFVLNGQEVKSYDFSVFQNKELDKISRELKGIRANLIK